MHKHEPIGLYRCLQTNATWPAMESGLLSAVGRLMRVLVRDKGIKPCLTPV